jgi:hypothetical protein
MTALSKFLVLLAIFLWEGYANALTSLSLVAGNQVRVIHLIQLQQTISNQTNEPSCEPICKPTNDQTTNEVQPSSTSNTSYTFEAVMASTPLIHLRQSMVSKPNRLRPSMV